MGSINESRTEKLLRYSFMPQFYIFLTGVCLQRVKAHQSRFIYGKGIYWAVAYLLFIYLAPDFSTKFLASSILLSIATISFAYTIPDTSRRVLKGTDISYGVYIYHGIILNILVEFRRFDSIYYLLILFAVTYVLAFLSWIYIEKPMLRRKTKTINEANVEPIPVKHLVTEEHCTRYLQ